jgi:hypothetical protein
MKGLAVALLATLAASAGAIAGPLEITIGGGPAATSLDDVNASIGVFNALILDLNETFAVHPDVTGSVEQLGPMVSGLSLRIGERYWLGDWLGFGAHFQYARSSSAATGFYQGSDVSTIDVALDFDGVGIVLGGCATFIDVGLLISAEIGVGYYFAILDRSVVFEVPSEYPDVISDVPPEGEGRYTGGALGFEIGLAMSYPVTQWFAIGSVLTYRSATVDSLDDLEGTQLDLDGDGATESVNLSGVAVQLTLSLSIDLSLDGKKE